MNQVRAGRAFTLVELLVVVGVLVAMAAIVLPWGSQVLERQAFERAVEDAMSQAVSARAWAQREGAVAELVALEGGARLEVRAVDLLRDAEEAGDGPDGAASADGMAAALGGSKAARRLKARMERRVADVAARTGIRAEAAVGPEDGAFDPRIEEPWAGLALEDGIVAGTEPPVEEGIRAEFSPADADDERVALFLPDGSAAAVRDLWISRGARVARLTVDPLLGEVRRSDGAPGRRRP